MPSPTSTSWTYDDLLELPEDGLRHELIGGEHFVTPSPSLRHQAIVGNLYAMLRRRVDETAEAWVLFAPFDVVLSQSDVVEPDLLVVSRDRRDLLTESHAAGPPDLVVEVLSPGTRKRDEGIKRELYERAGVDELWLVDPDAREVRIFRRRREAFAEPEVLGSGAGAVLCTPLLPGWEGSVDEVFESSGLGE